MKRKKEEKRWLMIYVWEPNPGRYVYTNEMTSIHPLKVVLNWHEKFQGNQNSNLIGFWEIPKELWERYDEQFCAGG